MSKDAKHSVSARDVMFYVLCAAAAAIAIAGCAKKESEGISRVTYYANLSLNGNTDTIVPLGWTGDPGATASNSETGEPITPIVRGDYSKAGKAVITYVAVNADGYKKEVTRTAYVYAVDPAPAIESGWYLVSPSSSRSALGGSPAATGGAEYQHGQRVAVIATGGGKYLVSDFFGGYYSVGRGYGSRYETFAEFNAAGGALTLERSGTTPWGDDLNSTSSGTYSGTSITLTADWAAGYTFHITLTKQSN